MMFLFSCTEKESKVRHEQAKVAISWEIVHQILGMKMMKEK
jgi:hypothetical protein